MERAIYPWYEVTPGPIGSNGTQQHRRLTDTEIWNLVRAGMDQGVWGEINRSRRIPDEAAILMIHRIDEIVQDGLALLRMMWRDRGMDLLVCTRAVRRFYNDHADFHGYSTLKIMLLCLSLAALMIMVEILRHQKQHDDMDADRHQRDEDNDSQTFHKDWQVIPYQPPIQPQSHPNPAPQLQPWPLRRKDPPPYSFNPQRHPSTPQVPDSTPSEGRRVRFNPEDRVHHLPPNIPGRVVTTPDFVVHGPGHPAPYPNPFTPQGIIHQFNPYPRNNEPSQTSQTHTHDPDSDHLRRAQRGTDRLKRLEEIHEQMENLHKELREIMQELDLYKP